MARVSNQGVYQRDIDLQGNDFLVGTDAQDNNATKSYTLEDLRTYITEGLGETIPDVIAREFIPVVSQDGSDIAKSPIRVISGTAVPNLNVSDTGADVEIGVDFDGTGYVQIIDNEDNTFAFNYRLRDLQGKRWMASIGEVVYTGTIATDGFQVPDFSTNTADPSQSRYESGDTHYVYRTTIARMDGNPVTLGASTIVDAMPGFVLQDPINPVQTWIVGDAIFQNNLSVNGTSQFNDHVTLGNQPDGDRVDLTVHGNIHINDSEGGLIFGEPEPSVRFTTDGDNLTIAGQGNVQIDNDTTFTQAVDVDCPGMGAMLPDIPGFVASPNDGDSMMITFAHATVCVMEMFEEGDTIIVTDSSATPQIIMGTAAAPTRDSILVNFRENAPVLTEPISLNSANRIGNRLTTVDCGVITLQGADGDRLIISDNGIRRIDSNGQTLPSVNVVDANPAGNPTAGLLTSIQIGVDGDGEPVIFSLPQTTSNVAEVLPGVNEILEGPAANITTGRFFYATEQGNSALFQAAVAAQPTGVQIMAGETSGVIVMAERAVFANTFNTIPEARALRPQGQGLFFLASTDTDDFPDVGMPVEGTLYEVISYDEGTGVFRFGLLGGGIFTIATGEIRFPSIPERVTEPNILFYDPEDGSIAHNPSRVLPTFRDATLNGTGLPTDGTGLNSISFVNTLVDTANDTNRHQRADADGNLEVDLSGRGYFGGRHTANASVAAFQTIILGTISANPANQDYAATITLPTGTSGDWIDVKNQSIFMHDATTNSLSLMNGQPVVVASGNWRIIPAAGEKINALPADTNLVLDNPRASFRLTFTNADNGWMITGVE